MQQQAEEERTQHHRSPVKRHSKTGAGLGPWPQGWMGTPAAPGAGTAL